MKACDKQAFDLARRFGFKIFPVRHKIPCVQKGDDWRSIATSDEKKLWALATDRTYGPRTGWAASMDGFAAIDIDLTKCPEEAAEWMRVFCEGDDWDEARCPATLTFRTGSGGLHMVYSDPEGVTKQKKLANKNAVETKASGGGYIVLPGSEHPDTGQPYSIEADVEIAPVPAGLDEMSTRTREAEREEAARAEGDFTDYPGQTWKEILGGAAPGDTHHRFVAAVAKLVKAGFDDDEIIDRCEPYLDRGSKPRDVDYLTEKIASAREKGFDNWSPELEKAADPGGADPTAEFSAIAGAMTDALATGDRAAMARAQRQAKSLEKTSNEALLCKLFIDGHGEDLRFCEKWNKYMKWTGSYWREESKAHAFTAIRDFCILKRNSTAKLFNNIESLVKRDSRIHVDPEDFDADDNMLCCPTMVFVDGQKTADRPDASNMNTKMTRCDPDFEAEPELWLQVLQMSFKGDDELVAYFQRVAGYMLTGTVREHALFFAYGSGANGKSTIVNALAHALADYSRVTAEGFLLERRNKEHSAEIATLKGARAVFVNEQADGVWNQTRVKELTGGDTVQARMLYGQPFDFKPTFKLFVSSNHKPVIRVNDEATARRLHFLPFVVTVPREERDPDLGRKLEAEAPAILAWAIKGWRAYLERGLDAPEIVQEAGRQYLAEQDQVSQFLEVHCTLDADGEEGRAGIRELYSAYELWAQEERIHPLARRSIVSQIEGKGFRKRKDTSGWHFRGIKLGKSDDFG